MFLRNTDGILDNIAIEDDNTKVSYGELEQLTQECTKIIGKRNVILIECNYDIPTVSFYYAVMNSGNIALLVGKDLDEQFLENLIAIYKPGYIWSNRRNIKEQYAKRIEWSDNEFLYKTSFEKYEVDNELALLLTTSGSTGSPKLVRLSYDNLRANASALNERMNMNQNDCGITTLPMNYTYGLSTLHIHWMIGGKVVISDEPVISEKFVQLIKEKNVTNFGGVPYSFDLLKKSNFLNNEFTSLRFIHEAGGKLDEENQKFFGNELKKKNIELYILYGQTEGTTILSGIPSHKVLQKLGSIGLPLNGLEAGIDEKNDELIFKGSSVSKGYAQSYSDLSYGDSNGGLLRTGDLAYIDSDGYIYLKGRIKRIIKILGVRYNLDEIENLLRCEFVNHDLACAGKDDFICIYIAGDIEQRKIINYCREKIKIKKQMIHIFSVCEIPRNNAGKIKYTDLQVV